MKVESIAECSKGSILQHFWQTLSNNPSWKPIFVFFLSGRLRISQVMQFYFIHSSTSVRPFLLFALHISEAFSLLSEI